MQYLLTKYVHTCIHKLVLIHTRKKENDAIIMGFSKSILNGADAYDEALHVILFAIFK